jgi:hypothetical protein
MPSSGFEPATPASEQPQTCVLDYAALRIGVTINYQKKLIPKCDSSCVTEKQATLATLKAV